VLEAREPASEEVVAVREGQPETKRGNDDLLERNDRVPHDLALLRERPPAAGHDRELGLAQESELRDVVKNPIWRERKHRIRYGATVRVVEGAARVAERECGAHAAQLLGPRWSGLHVHLHSHLEHIVLLLDVADAEPAQERNAQELRWNLLRE